ncbi:helix-turn-helix domain-containing protein [Streptomyces sp. R302]|uniref:helix-turn-helix domain-containing protein n=1 Tax=unclassified Streptomyces TaxID=2593676 RepID=UPI00145DAC6E|nr:MULTISPECIES: helix-turn-helix transcriptional regulator [unclassified Streptomyces]NML48930.1 helix-turn-helix domain-containing protein [Streptomyces sp. R301]NML77257.1 helix-turn-helix domain-containing protein [Streptomyces sp. R302]
MAKDAAVEEFAGLVRALKTRDGRSYEALGRRLNVSASTLHRYCSGATVPEDFAVVDRLARLCGADEEERRALEAAWTRADGARRPPAPEPGAEPTSAPEPVPVPVAAPEPELDPVHARVPGLPSERRRRRWGWVGVVGGALAVVGAVTLGAVLLPGKTGERVAEPPAPLTWTVASHIWKNGCGHTYLVERTPPPPPEAADARSWATAQGAVDGGETLVRVSVQGKGAAAVVLQALHVRVVERGAPLPWAAYRTDDGCGGAVTPRRFEVDLDRPRPVARALDGYDASGQEGRTIPAVSFPYAVTAAEPEELRVSARTAGCDCRWYLELEWSAEGRSGTVRIGDEDGQPFRTSGVGRGPVYGYDSVGRAWITGRESGQGG